MGATLMHHEILSVVGGGPASRAAEACQVCFAFLTLCRAKGQIDGHV